MKILYAVQATGNGHISRAHQLYPHLAELGQVDIVLSGSNSSMEMDIPITYRCKGLSLFYSKCGSLDYWATYKSMNFSRTKKEIADLPVEKYDLVINDFDLITAQACKRKKVNSIQLGHQASFMSEFAPRPSKKSIVGETILKHYAPATEYLGFHFERYDSFVFPPVIKQEIVDAKPLDHGHITVYTPAYKNECHETLWRNIAPFEIHWFLEEVKKPYKDGNIHYYPISQKYFNESLINCHALITGGGFETPAEALYLRKKLLTIPIEGQYEQQCNAQALVNKGIKRMSILNHKTELELHEWLKSKENSPLQEAANIGEVMEKIVDVMQVQLI